MQRAFLPLCLWVAGVLLSSCNMGEIIRDDEEDVMPRIEVYEYLPAPGQYIGEGGSPQSAKEAAEWARERLEKGQYVSLGAFGGYIVMGLDTPITATGREYDFVVKGNATATSSEPGIVWVMRDDNGNGAPDDRWFELAGEDEKGGTVDAGSIERGYSITYFKPSAPGQPVRWVDSHGTEGEVDYLPSYHLQPYYYPTWVAGESFTLSGTRLKSRAKDESGAGTMWVSPPYGKGYADDFSFGGQRNCFRLSNAIDADGNPVQLKSIDFVKVQTGVCGKCGWTGEISTEVLGLEFF
ncbi:MAG: hypothetical protein HUJ91_02115 [Bacteroidales bacterium]|nr:hypothetical protein [Bacteroidales bacterium]